MFVWILFSGHFGKQLIVLLIARLDWKLIFEFRSIKIYQLSSNILLPIPRPSAVSLNKDDFLTSVGFVIVSCFKFSHSTSM